MFKFLRLCHAVAVAAMFIAAAPAWSAAVPCERPTSLRVALIPHGDTEDQALFFQPLFDALQKALGIPVTVTVASSYGAVSEGLLAGAIDLARLGPAAYVSAHKSDARITPFASLFLIPDIFNDVGSSSYRSLLIVRARGPIKSIAALQGKRLALIDPDSASGALIPLHVFARQIGSSLDSYFARVGYSGNHEQSVRAVLNNDVDAAFVSSSSLAAQINAGEVKRSDIRVLWKSQAIPFDPFVYRSQLCEDVKKKIRKIFFDQKSPDLKLVLDKLHAQNFVAIKDGDFQIIRDLP